MGVFGFGKKKESGGDFSGFDSMDEIQDGVKKGVLAPMYIISPVFGGAEDISNTLYVPPAVIPFKESIDRVLEDALRSGKNVQGFSVKPEYKGKSKVPSKIAISAGGDVDIKETINVW